jgi:hypothetical protein
LFSAGFLFRVGGLTAYQFIPLPPTNGFPSVSQYFLQSIEIKIVIEIFGFMVTMDR